MLHTTSLNFPQKIQEAHAISTSQVEMPMPGGNGMDYIPRSHALLESTSCISLLLFLYCFEPLIAWVSRLGRCHAVIYFNLHLSQRVSRLSRVEDRSSLCLVWICISFCGLSKILLNSKRDLRGKSMYEPETRSQRHCKHTALHLGSIMPLLATWPTPPGSLNHEQQVMSSM